MIPFAEWHRVIHFEDTDLPAVAIAIDHLAKPQNLPELSEETSLWLWQFTACVGLPRTETAAQVLKHAEEALALAEHFHDRLIRTVPQGYDASFTPGVIDAWIGALRTMIRIASSRAQCTWVARLRPGDAAYEREPGEVIQEVGAGMERAFRKVNEAKGESAVNKGLAGTE